MGTDTYLILEKPDRCQLAKIRSLIVSQVQLTHKGKLESYLLNEEHKIILGKVDKQRSEECDLTYFTTGYPELMVVPDSQLEPSPIHPNALIRDRGDIIQEMQCKTVEVTSSPGYQRHDNVLKNICPYI